jgi:hypothetical protein
MLGQHEEFDLDVRLHGGAAGAVLQAETEQQDCTAAPTCPPEGCDPVETLDRRAATCEQGCGDTVLGSTCDPTCFESCGAASACPAECAAETLDTCGQEGCGGRPR